ncbi:tripartite tricarboxylate transporter substrate binding protein [Rhodovarius crocodyli]|uniref:Tripartite tricarboxylate transporter substrate binding protein n=1 Tax=Rhodovarius crocodyli TaxID=1979269 RepID=A0A437MP11_9PROT|nr:tripartite tricarboxylate transporter substrate-binding protein [Rhodovarius crocodyli]RVT99352.1 tripartite tricarboxylate transporter substrate binding protein [Rhodovarius crocodyli]
MFRRALLSASAAVLALPAVSRAQAWPEKPIRLLVPVAPGGSQDIVARLFARHMGPVLGQNVVVENLPGAGSNIGYEAVVRARPDGYVLGAGSDSLSINKGLFRRLNFDPVEDITPVAEAARVPQILVVAANSPVNTLSQFVELAKGRPVAVGTPGNGSLSHLLQQQLQDASEVQWTHAPYRGGALALQDLMGGSLQGVMINIGAVTDHVKAGRLKGVVVSSPARTQALPDVPTFAEAGLNNADAVGWHGLFAPRGTPEELVAKINTALRQALRDEELAGHLNALGIEPSDTGPEYLGQRLRADATRWAGVIERARLLPD